MEITGPEQTDMSLAMIESSGEASEERETEVLMMSFCAESSGHKSLTSYVTCLCCIQGYSAWLALREDSSLVV